jgi:MauM/NapG family ferredoxin protein
MITPLSNYIEDKIDLPITPPPRTLLRPPGAVPEPQFIQDCYRSGHCVEACPVSAIRPQWGLDEHRDGTPFIDPDITACVACDSVACTKVCPSGALLPIDSPQLIRMGLAVVDDIQCLRTLGDHCTTCIERCPIGPDAIELGDDNFIKVLENGCTGCGVCQQYCPTEPRSIQIQPY